ncbi:MAG TPA: EAL domain-containing protein [Steroidobacteraceae bacterium]|jgi:diguanylate cyclase (GGDEF)-like protein|nr:EAL domain-containing protein [Steroidobacteraceae bacterium]
MKIQLQLVVVEDSVADAELLARHLAKSGLNCTINRVQTEPEFIAALHRVKPDLILSDFSLPDFGGLRALDLAVVHAPDTPFIYVSGTIGEERAIDALRRGATDYVLKSNLSRLSSAIERALREAALRAERRHSEQVRTEQEERLRRLTRTYRMLSSTSSAILRLQSRTELLDEVCRIAVQQGGYQRSAISLVDSSTKTLSQLACAGLDSQPHNGTAYVMDPIGPQSDLMEDVIRTGMYTVHNDLHREAPNTQLRESSILLGYRAVAALPLKIRDATIGVIRLFSTEPGVFDAAEVAVLLELTANISFALQYLEKDAAVQFLSYFDSLTGLAKRPLFCQRLAQTLAKDAPAAAHTVVVFDVQKLGAINDSFGRYVGDSLIEKIAARLKQTYTDSDCVGYFGGGTFVISIAESRDPSDTGLVLQSAAAPLFSEPFQIDGQEFRPTIRSGVAVYPHDAKTADALVQNAEAALKAAREDNEKYMMYGLVTQRPTSRSLALEARLTRALEHEEFLIQYQPKVDLKSGHVQGLEALLRWKDSEDGIIAPSVFIPMLEQSGAIVDVGEWVLLQAAEDVRRWRAAGLQNLRVAVNVSPLQLRRRDFVDRVLAVLATSRAGNAGLDIEITESMLMHDLELSIRKLTQLREAGLGVAIDDFGTGYSSLRLLAKLPVDTLKIDKSFVQSIADTPSLATLVSTIVSLARSFNMKTIAEGVETAEQLQKLRHMKCDQAQGYLFSRPVPTADVPSVISRLESAQSTNIDAIPNPAGSTR